MFLPLTPSRSLDLRRNLGVENVERHVDDCSRPRLDRR